MSTDEKTRKRFLAALGVLIIAALGTAICLGLYYGIPTGKKTDQEDRSTNLPVSVTSTPTESKLGNYSRAAVSTDAASDCAQIGTDFLKRNASAVDAAIATHLCVCVINPHSCGIGGGHFMTIYSRKNKTVTTIVGRERAPLAATKDMFLSPNVSSVLGGLSIGVPGELLGMHEAHKMFGKLPWRELFQPAIQLCRVGHPVSPDMANAIQGSKEKILKFPELKNLLWNNATKDWYKTREIMKMPELADTFEKIAERGADEFYKGNLSKDILSDLADSGSIIKEEDLLNYTVLIKPALSIQMKGGYTVYSPPLPSGGAVYLYILNILDGYNFTEKNLADTNSSILTYHRITEAFKFAYAKRSNLGDGDFLPGMQTFIQNMTSKEFGGYIRSMITDNITHDYEYYKPAFYQNSKTGTAHMSLLAPDGDAVSVTTSINLHFGSKVVGRRTGIIFNNEMDDFSTPNTTNSFGVPASPANFIVPRKRPLSSMCPSIVVDQNGDVVLVVGASGGTRILTGVATTTMYTLLFNKNIKEAIDYPRIHHQLLPPTLDLEKGFPHEIANGLKKKDHQIKWKKVASSRVQGIHQTNNRIYANADYRKEGQTAGF